MQDNKTAQMREYLKLKQIQENDESDEIIEEVCYYKGRCRKR